MCVMYDMISNLWKGGTVELSIFTTILQYIVYIYIYVYIYITYIYIILYINYIYIFFLYMHTCIVSFVWRFSDTTPHERLQNKKIVPKTRLEGVSKPFHIRPLHLWVVFTHSFHSIPWKFTMTWTLDVFFGDSAAEISRSIGSVSDTVRGRFRTWLDKLWFPFFLDATRIRLWFAHRWVEEGTYFSHVADTSRRVAA